MMIFDKLFFLKRSVWCNFEFSILFSFFELFAEKMIFSMDEAFEKHIYILQLYISIDFLYSRFFITLKRIFFSLKKSHIRVEMKRSFRNIEYEFQVYNYLLQNFLKSEDETDPIFYLWTYFNQSSTL